MDPELLTMNKVPGGGEGNHTPVDALSFLSIGNNDGFRLVGGGYSPLRALPFQPAERRGFNFLVPRDGRGERERSRLLPPPRFLGRALLRPCFSPRATVGLRLLSSLSRFLSSGNVYIYIYILIT